MVRRVAVLVLFAVVGSYSPVPAQEIGGWVSANAVVDKPATDSTTQAAVFPYRQETFQSTQVYTQKNKPSFDIDGGVRFGSFGAGVGVSRYSDNETVLSRISVPSRFSFANLAVASGSTQNPLTHEETALHLEGRYIANLPHMSLAVFAGPSYIKTTQEIVTDNTYQEIDTLSGLHTVQITNYSSRSAELHAWGYNVGVDAAYYFSTFFGVGGLVRFSQATVQLPNDLQSADGRTVTQDLKVGGLNVGGGVRVRF